MAIQQQAQTQVTITERALYQRIARKLRNEGDTLRTLRGERWFTNLGRYYTVDICNCISGTHYDLEQLGHELGVLRSWEELEAEEAK